MALSAANYVGDGVVKDYPLDFTLGYLDTSHIHVYLDEVEQLTGWSITMSGSMVTFDTPPANEVDILIRRITPNDVLAHDYSDGAQIIEENLDESNLQALMLFHEAIDGFTDRGRGTNLNMGGLRITNLGDPIDPTDAMTYQASLSAIQEAESARDAAEGYANDAEVHLDEFKGIYLGKFASPPPASSYDTGVFYFDTTQQKTYILTDDDWRPMGALVETVRDTLYQTNVKGQDTFLIDHDVGLVDVYYNGTLLNPNGDYTSDGTQVVLNEPVDYADDEIFIKAWGNVATFTNSGLTQRVTTLEELKGAVALLADVKPNGTQGGSSVSGMQVRDLNTKLSDDQDIVTLGPGAGEFTLGAGKYLIEWSAPSYSTDRHQASLYRSTGLVQEGLSSYVNPNGGPQNSSYGSVIVTTHAEEVFYIQHFINYAQDINGLGVESDSGNNEVYTQVKIQKIG